MPPLMSRGHVVAKYKFIKRLGYGSFGEVWLGFEVHSKEKVAIKVESATAKKPQLHREYSLYSRYLQGHEGFPVVKHYAEAKECTYLVMTLLGENLQKLLNLCGGQFSLKTVLMIADQVLSRLETLHKATGYVTRDVKPDNLIMGRKNTPLENTLFLIDLGLSKPYRDHETGEHIIQRSMKKSLTGTARYASINAHFGGDQSRKDDLESAGYVFVYLFKGKLPWQGIRASTKKKRYDMIRDVKMATANKELCKGIPDEFCRYMDYCKSLSFQQEPDYEFLREIFRDLMQEKGYSYDNEFDWSTLSRSDDDSVDT